METDGSKTDGAVPTQSSDRESKEGAKGRGREGRGRSPPNKDKDHSPAQRLFYEINALMFLEVPNSMQKKILHWQREIVEAYNLVTYVHCTFPVLRCMCWSMFPVSLAGPGVQ